MAKLVWDRLGDVDNYCEPFCGSAAMLLHRTLLARPHPPRIETLNDADCHVANFWRATSKDPTSVAEYADWPVNEADLHARHRWLVLSEAAAEFRQRMRTDPDYFDPRVAGWWCWGACCWIGGGWCQEPETEHGRGVHGKSKLRIDGDNKGSHGKGVHAKGLSEQMPMISQPGGGTGIAGIPDNNRVRGGLPQLADAFSRGRGVHNDNHLAQRMPTAEQCQTGGKGVHGAGPGAEGTCAQRRAWLLDWFNRLRDRLRTVRVCCGHWLRVCDSESVTTRLGVTGLFLDPPYPTHSSDGEESRSGGLYATDGSRDSLDQLRDEVLAYCLERGPDPKMRIAVCGYDTDGYAELEKHGWQVVAWKAQGGYGNRSDKGKANAGRERIWFSPACKNERSLFDNMEEACEGQP